MPAPVQAAGVRAARGRATVPSRLPRDEVTTICRGAAPSAAKRFESGAHTGLGKHRAAGHAAAGNLQDRTRRIAGILPRCRTRSISRSGTRRRRQACRKPDWRLCRRCAPMHRRVARAGAGRGSSPRRRCRLGRMRCRRSRAQPATSRARRSAPPVAASRSHAVLRCRPASETTATPPTRSRLLSGDQTSGPAKDESAAPRPPG